MPFLVEPMNQQQTLQTSGVAGNVKFYFNTVRPKLGNKFKAFYGFYLELNTAITQALTTGKAFSGGDLALLISSLVVYRDEQDQIVALDGCAAQAIMAVMNEGQPKAGVLPTGVIANVTGSPVTTAKNWRLWFLYEGMLDPFTDDHVWGLGMFEKGRIEVTVGDPTVQLDATITLGAGTNNIDATILYGLRDRMPLGSKLRYRMIEDSSTTSKKRIIIPGGNILWLVAACKKFSASNTSTALGLDDHTLFTSINSIVGGQPLKFPDRKAALYNEVHLVRGAVMTQDTNNIIAQNKVVVLQGIGRNRNKTDETFRTSQDFTLDTTLSGGLAIGHRFIVVYAEDPSAVDVSDAKKVAGLDPSKGLRSRFQLKPGLKMPSDPTRVTLLPKEIAPAAPAAAHPATKGAA